MKVVVLVPLTILVTVGLFGFMKMRQKVQDKEAVRSRFQDIKLRVTRDMLEEFQKEAADMVQQLDDSQKEQNTLGEAAKDLQGKVEAKKSEADACRAGQQAVKDDLASAETAFSGLKAETDKEEADWKTELETLKQKLAARSPICDHLKKGSDAASKLCNSEAPKPEGEKAEAPKEQVQAEAPKQEEAKPEAAKPEEVKPEAAKAEAPKQEEAKPEAAKGEAPKQEEAKPEAPKQR